MNLVKSEKLKVKNLNQGEHDHGGHDHTEHHRMMMVEFRRKFWVILPATLVVLLLSPQIQMWLGFRFEVGGRDILLFLLGSVIALYGGWPFYTAAKDELRTRNYGMITLVSLAVISGYLFSVAATFLFPGESLWWEISTLVLAFLFGHWMEMKAVVGTGGALKELAKLIPPAAHKIKAIGTRQEAIDEVDTEDLKKGDMILVKPGEKIPADGEVVRGESSVNEGMVTGESRPIEKKKGSLVIGGTVNNDGSLTITVTQTGAESALSQIMDLIRRAQETKPNVQKLADKAANLLTITAIVVGSGTFVYWTLINPAGAVFAATLAITVIVIACPHALGLAIPTVTTITSSLAAKNGILIKDMRGLEIARKLDYLVLDKTGTLTEGNFGVAKILTREILRRSGASRATRSAQDDDADLKDLKSVSASSNDEILRLAAAVEVQSQHSIAQGIVEEAKRRQLELETAEKFKSYPGKGAEAWVKDKKVVVGNAKMMKEKGITNYELRIKDRLGTLVYVAKNKEYLGTIILEDQVRKESKQAIGAFHDLGIKVAMLTGDKKEVAEKVGKVLGIDTVFAEVLPEDKVNKVKELQDKGQMVGMVGDGVNDAPSLTQAHVGIAIGAGTSVAIESAEIVLMKSNPMDIVKVLELSRKTDSKMKQNLAWATGYNALAIPAAAGVFYSWGVTLRPEWGALLMSASSIIVVANAMLLRRARLSS
ncbi:MAG: heavy metal translocating P-type ATPase [Candidatus Chisholmbacteria bacterium]|nr:heavy metal translocating P-type ATPase [Candidatus Chisholmbacteria bacterium]